MTDLAAAMLETTLPSGDEWLVERVDWAEIYRLPEDAIREFFEGLNNAKFPRRQSHHFGNEGLAFRGDTTSVTLYHKGPEFVRNDLRRLSTYLPAAEVATLVEVARETLRGEVSVKAQKLSADFGGKPCLSDVQEKYLDSLYDREMSKIMADASNVREAVRTERAVADRLTVVYGGNTGQRLFGVWCLMARYGEDAARREVSRTTHYRNREFLLDAGCPWLATDVHGPAASLPVDFRLTGDSPYRDRGVDFGVEAQLAFFADSDINVLRTRYAADICLDTRQHVWPGTRMAI